jgi:hypothetical protein
MEKQRLKRLYPIILSTYIVVKYLIALLRLDLGVGWVRERHRVEWEELMPLCSL